MNAAAPPGSPPRRLWLARHAPVLAAPGLCYGRLDLPADPQATQAAAQQMALHLPAGLRHLRCSPRQRCQQLALALQRLRPGLDITLDTRLAEMDFGCWEGQPWRTIARTEFDAWLACFADHPPGGGETVRRFMLRVGAAWDDWLADGAALSAWVTHGGVIRAVRLLAQGVRVPLQASDWPADAVPLGDMRSVTVPAADDGAG